MTLASHVVSLHRLDVEQLRRPATPPSSVRMREAAKFGAVNAPEDLSEMEGAANLEFLAEIDPAFKVFSATTMLMASNVAHVHLGMWATVNVTDVNADVVVRVARAIQVYNVTIRRNHPTIVAVPALPDSLGMEHTAMIWTSATLLNRVTPEFAVSTCHPALDVTHARQVLQDQLDFKGKDWNSQEGIDRDAMTLTNATTGGMVAASKTLDVSTRKARTTVGNAVKGTVEIKPSDVITVPVYVPMDPSAMTIPSVFALLDSTIMFANAKLDGPEMEKLAVLIETWMAGLIMTWVAVIGNAEKIIA